MRIEALRAKLTRENYEFVRKEIMLNLNLDLTQLVDPVAFKRFYAFKDAKKDATLEEIRSKENRYQSIGIFSAIPFMILSVKQKDVKYFLPGLLLIGGFKYYSG